MESSKPGAAVEPLPRWLSSGIVLLLALVAANLLAWRSVEPDLWGHIQYGTDWLAAGTMPRTATHTWSTPDQPWINHENIFELSVALGQQTLGGHGLMVLKCLTGLWLLSSMMRFAMRRGVPVLAAAVTMIPVALGLAEFWLMRPQLFSFVFFAWMLLAFERAFADWSTKYRARTRWLWVCVPLIAVWTNSHGGFLAGLCVLLAMLGLRALEAVWHQGLAAARTAAEFALIGIASIAAVFVNPYGWELPWWMLVSLSQPRPEVSEWAGLLDSGVSAIPFLVLTALTLLSLWQTRQRRDVVELIVLGLIAVQVIGHIRHVAFFALTFGYWMPAHLVSLWNRLVEWRPSLGVHETLTPRAARWLKMQMSAVATALCVLLGHSFAGFGVDRAEYPVTAFEFMTKHGLNGRLVVTFDWAQYALAALAPETTVGFDGRYDTCYPQTVVDMNFDLLFGVEWTRRHRSADSGPINPDRVLEFGNPDLVLLDRTMDVPAVRHLERHPDWVLLYSDGLAVLWGRRTVFDAPSGDRYFPPERRWFSDDMPQGIAAWPAFPDRGGRNAFLPAEAAAAAQKRGSQKLTRSEFLSAN